MAKPALQSRASAGTKLHARDDWARRSDIPSGTLRGQVRFLKRCWPQVHEVFTAALATG
jgi:hypothetical protein